VYHPRDSVESHMLHGQKIVVVMPAYHAEKTLADCYAAIPHDVVDLVLLVDDASDDATLAVAKRLGIVTHRHPENRGYGANQKTCYAEALAEDADIVVMLHPDYQYEPRLITAMAAMVASGVYDVVIGSRILGNTALAGGMPRYKYVANRVLTALQNLIVGAKLSEFHTGYRAFSRRVLETLRFRQPDAGAGARLRSLHRRNFLSHALLRRRERDQLRELDRLRLRRAVDQPAVPPVAVGACASAHLLRASRSAPAENARRRRGPMIAVAVE